MKQLLIILTLSFSNYLMGQLAVTDATVNSQLVKLQSQTNQLMAQNKALLHTIQDIQRMSKEESLTKKNAPNDLLYVSKLNELTQVKNSIVSAGKGLSYNIKDMKHLNASDYSDYLNNTAIILQNSMSVCAQIQTLMRIGGTIIPAHERLQALDSSYELLRRNLDVINSYNSILQGLNKTRSIQKIR